MTYNVYRFSENAPDNRVFDVRNCYENGGSVSFDMQLEGENDGHIDIQFPRLPTKCFGYSYTKVSPPGVLATTTLFVSHSWFVYFCLLQSGDIFLFILIVGNWTGFNAENNLQLLEYWFTLSVEAFADVRAIRVTDVEVDNAS